MADEISFATRRNRVVVSAMTPEQPAAAPRTPTGRHAPFALLYLGEGAPIGFVWWALPTWLRTRGVSVEDIATLSGLLVMPWVVKFLWAPLIDRSAHLRRWIVTAQFIMAAALVPIPWLDPVERFEAFRLCLLLHALAAATQDVAVDALALRVVPEVERGRLNAFMQVVMLGGRSLFGGGALVIAGTLGWNAVVAALIGCILACSGAVMWVREPARPSATAPGGTHPKKWGEVLSRPVFWLGMGFALTAASAFEFAGAMAGPVMVDHGMATEFIGVVLGAPVVAATMLGSALGGRSADRFGHRRVVGAGVIVFTAAVLVWAGAIAAESLVPGVAFILLAFLYLGVGMFTAASYALFMDLSQPPYSATQFSTFMSATNGCEAWAVASGGLVAARVGHPIALVILAGVSLLALLWLRGLRAAPRNRTLAPA